MIKAQDANIQFVLLTGVSKFSKVSLFSGLNNLTDITLDSEYATICGYKEHLSRYMKQVQSGETIIVTDRKKEVVG